MIKNHLSHITDGEDFWRGIRDGGRRKRRSYMYDFLRRHKDGGGLTDENDRYVYEVCLRTAKRLSKNSRRKPNDANS